jgi:hypothetical protein
MPGVLSPLAFALVAALAGDPSFDEGVRLYNELEYEQAIFRFEEIALRPGQAPADKATALVWLGMSYAGTGDLDSARRMFGDALRVDAATALPPNVSPRIVAMFDEVKAAAVTVVPEKPVEPAPLAPSTPEVKTPEEKPSEGPSVGLIAAATAGGVGVAALGAGALFAVFAGGHYTQLTATNPKPFQDEAKTLRDTMNLEITGAAVLIPTGLALLGTGAALLFVDLPE